jgi:ATP-dependent helicase HrpA
MQPAAVLPVLEHRAEIADAIEANPVVVVCGETGSGKTTQIPQICLELGRGAKGRLIGVTQPRRLAAVTVAERVSRELGADRRLVGWQHRFGKSLSRDNRVKFMTDGILLSELRSDPLLRAYDTVMVDEAHERTLNVDFVLGCLRRILPRRPDLRVIVSSATLETKAFSDFFGGAPVLSIPGRAHPVEVRWRPPEGEEPDLPAAVADAVEECLAGPYEGDVLVFLSGERDIRAAAEALRGRRLPGVEAIPLLASLPPAEQRRAFQTVPGVTRVVLATNVAETSVTIPGVRYVVDTGLARLSRYNPRARVKRLRVEPISQASAEQRKGRCGRIGPGVCIRLYSEEDFARRPAQTDPEIRRASLAGTILSMLDWKLGDIADFPFLQPPASAAVRDGRKELLELGAVRENAQCTVHDAQCPGPPSQGSAERAVPASARPLQITSLGRKLAKLPLEPSLSRMLYEADAQGALRDALTVVSALACEDPLLRPAEKQEEARQAHAAFRDKGSDFDGILLLWRHYHDPAHPLSRSAMRRDCEKRFVSYRRMCEWEDVRDRLEEALRRDGLRVDSDGGGDPGLHRALLSGLLSNIGVRDPEEKDYRGAGGTRFVLFPGSGLAKAKAPPQWVMAAELVDTARLYARRAAAIDPEWIEPLARHVCRYHYTGEAWDPKTGTARATRRAVLYGLVVQDGVRCDISRALPELARSLLIREGLVGGAFPKPVPAIVRRNLETIAARTEEARKTRALSVDLETDAFCAFLDERLPAECTSAAALRDWLARVPPAEAEKLLIPRPESPAARPSSADFPDYVELLVRTEEAKPQRAARRSLRLPLSYKHSPRADDDGITCSVPPEAIPLLPLLDATRLVPGALPGFVAWLLRTLPHSPLSLLAARCGHSPRTPDIDAIARLVLDRLPPEGELIPTLVETLAREFGVRLPRDTWLPEDVPAQFRIRWRVVDARGRERFASRDLDEILAFREEYDRLAPGALPAREEFVFEGGFRELPSLRRFSDCPPLPDRILLARIGGREQRAYPALCANAQCTMQNAQCGDAEHSSLVTRYLSLRVAVRLFPTAAEARASHAEGAAALADLSLSLSPPASAPPFARAAARRALAEVFGEDPPRSGAALESWAKPRVARCRQLARDLRTLAEAVDGLAHECLDTLDAVPALHPDTVRDVAEQIGWLCPPDFAAVVPSARLAEYPRYLEAIRKRLAAASFDPSGDRRKTAPVREAWERYAALVGDREGNPPFDEAAAERYRWLVEEYRVAVFAQALGTAEPASRPRLDRLWAEVVG